MGNRRWAFGLALLSTWGCGGTSAGGGEQAPTDGGGLGGQAAVDEGDAIVTHSPLEPGRCGIERTFQLPPPRQHAQAPVTRQGENVALGPWRAVDASALRTFVVGDGGESRFFDAPGSSNDLSWPAYLVESGLTLEVIVTRVAGAPTDSFDSRVSSAADDAPRARGTVLESFWRGTDSVALLPTLDGQQAVFAVWPHALAAPQAAVVGADGARAGLAHTFVTADAAMSCARVTPTTRGGYVSFVDSNQDLRLTELGAEGQVLTELKWRLPSAGPHCPAFALADDGLVFLLDRADYEQSPDIGFYRWVAGGTVEEVSGLPSTAGWREVAMWGGEPLVLRGVDGDAELYRPLSGERWPVFLPFGVPTRVASEPGELWLDFEVAGSTRNVVQLTCR